MALTYLHDAIHVMQKCTEQHPMTSLCIQKLNFTDSQDIVLYNCTLPIEENYIDLGDLQKFSGNSVICTTKKLHESPPHIYCIKLHLHVTHKAIPHLPIARTTYHLSLCTGDRWSQLMMHGPTGFNQLKDSCPYIEHVPWGHLTPQPDQMYDLHIHLMQVD